MGVSGSGKTTSGTLLAEELGRRFVDGDDLHPPSNKQKMALGYPLDDFDREPWLKSVGQQLALSPAPVVACSALKVSYRDAIRKVSPATIFIHLVGPPSLIAIRVADRAHEYMPASLLQSQFETLEPLGPTESGFVVDTEGSPTSMVEIIARSTRAGAVLPEQLPSASERD